MKTLFGIQFGFIFLTFVFDFGRSELYPSIQWTPLNPIFAANRTQCVHPMSKLIFVCPNTATVVTKLVSSSFLDPQYENLWLVSSYSYERCEVNKTTDYQLLLCDNPFNLKYYTTIFKRYSASNDPVFEPGKDYYFIATSDGKQSSIQSTSGGYCKTHNMKLKFHICKSSEDPRCQSSDMCNGITPTQAPSTAVPTKPTVTAAVTTQKTTNASCACANDTLPTTSVDSDPGNPESRLLAKEFTYQIVIGVLVFMCVIILVISAILIFRLHRKKKATSSSSPDSASYVIRVGTDSPDGDWD